MTYQDLFGVSINTYLIEKLRIFCVQDRLGAVYVGTVKCCVLFDPQQAKRWIHAREASRSSINVWAVLLFPESGFVRMLLSDLFL